MSLRFRKNFLNFQNPDIDTQSYRKSKIIHVSKSVTNKIDQINSNSVKSCSDDSKCDGKIENSSNNNGSKSNSQISITKKSKVITNNVDEKKNLNKDKLKQNINFLKKFGKNEKYKVIIKDDEKDQVLTENTVCTLSNDNKPNCNEIVYKQEKNFDDKLEFFEKDEIGKVDIILKRKNNCDIKQEKMTYNLCNDEMNEKKNKIINLTESINDETEINQRNTLNTKSLTRISLIKNKEENKNDNVTKDDDKETQTDTLNVYQTNINSLESSDLFDTYNSPLVNSLRKELFHRSKQCRQFKTVLIKKDKNLIQHQEIVHLAQIIFREILENENIINLLKFNDFDGEKININSITADESNASIKCDSINLESIDLNKMELYSSEYGQATFMEPSINMEDSGVSFDTHQDVKKFNIDLMDFNKSNKNIENTKSETFASFGQYSLSDPSSLLDNLEVKSSSKTSDTNFSNINTSVSKIFNDIDRILKFKHFNQEKLNINLNLQFFKLLENDVFSESENMCYKDIVCINIFNLFIQSHYKLEQYQQNILQYQENVSEITKTNSRLKIKVHVLKEKLKILQNELNEKDNDININTDRLNYIDTLLTKNREMKIDMKFTQAEMIELYRKLDEYEQDNNQMVSSMKNLLDISNEIEKYIKPDISKCNQNISDLNDVKCNFIKKYFSKIASSDSPTLAQELEKKFSNIKLMLSNS
ncbi:hypothetical protein A3Q56_02936 [Intoshia linei]|uniref:Uncharacterized protein n=1 Tax=Intoshia linei TaxID=1819745 RepID=A0A177B6L7_9BILA|nr:hypothetical protein A3Q56_02936 [Intoshia linei]